MSTVRLPIRGPEAVLLIAIGALTISCVLLPAFDFAALTADSTGFEIERLPMPFNASFAREHDVFLATSDGNLYRTDDRTPDADWTPLSSPSSAAARLVFVSAAGTIFVSPEKQPLQRSLDGGQTWSLTLDVPCWRMDEDDQGALYAGNYTKDGIHPAALFKSVDGGDTWSEVFRLDGCDHIHTVRFDPHDARLYIAWGDCFLRGQGVSSDRGATWQILAAGPDEGHTDVAFTRDYVFWASDDQSGRVWRAARQGGAAEPLMGFSQFMWFAVTGDDVVYIGTVVSRESGGERAALLASPDQGATWQKLLESDLSTGPYSQGYAAESRRLTADGWLYLSGNGEGLRIRRAQ